jgi:L-threonylcarbamoyladenylate synthase
VLCTCDVIISQTVASYSRIASVVARGGVIAFRTDTLYGLGADPFSRQGVQKIKQLKGRERRKPILILLSDLDQVPRFVAEPSQTFQLLAQTLWPGPLTLIGKATGAVLYEITALTQTVGVRLPDDDNVRALVRACGGALTATSANPARKEPARSAEEVFRYFGHAVDLIVDGGPARSVQPSTVVKVCKDKPRLIRDGVISWTNIRAAIEHPWEEQS